MRRNLTGLKFGRLTVISEAGRTPNYEGRWLCRCDCGNERVIIAGSLTTGNTRSCGCISREFTSNLRKNTIDDILVRIDFEGPVPQHRLDLGPCWLWTGHCASGYGLVGFGGEYILVHRIFYGPISADKELDHLCRVRRCMRPSHLEPVTSYINFIRGNNPLAVKVRNYYGVDDIT